MLGVVTGGGVGGIERTRRFSRAVASLSTGLSYRSNWMIMMIPCVR